MISGDFQGKCSKFEFGADKNDKPMIRIEMEVVDGASKGTRVPYDGKLNPDNIKYTKQALLALGWQGKDIKTAHADITTSPKTVTFKVEIATWNKPDGSVKQWSAVRSIGFAAKPLAPLAAEKVANVNEWFAEVAQSEAGESNGNSDLPF